MQTAMLVVWLQSKVLQSKSQTCLLLSLQIDQAPELMRPAKCLPSPSRDQEPDVTDWGPYCEAAKKLAASGNCTNTNDKITREKPLLKCSYRSLSNFYQMQQHIRNHGAIVSRIIMNVGDRITTHGLCQCGCS
jgi:hypothetical protein